MFGQQIGPEYFSEKNIPMLFNSEYFIKYAVGGWKERIVFEMAVGVGVFQK